MVGEIQMVSLKTKFVAIVLGLSLVPVSFLSAWTATQGLYDMSTFAVAGIGVAAISIIT